MAATGFDTIAVKHASKTASFTADLSAGSYLCDATSGAITATLPAISKSSTFKDGKRGAILTFRKTDASTNAITVTAAGSDTILGQSTFKLTNRSEFVTLQADGINSIWRVVARYVAPSRVDAIKDTAQFAVGPINGWAWFWRDFFEETPTFYTSTNFTYSSAMTNSGTITAANEAAGAINVTSGVTGSSGAELLGQNGIGAALNSKAFYFQARAAVTTTVDAQATAFVGISDASNTIGFGVIGGLSTTQLVIQHSGNYTGTKVNLAALDTSYHVYEMWGSGDGNVTYRIDGGTTAALTAPTALTAIKYAIYVTNGSTAAARTMKVDYLAIGCAT